MTTTERGPQLSTLARLAAAGGRTDTLRIALTVLGTAATTLVLLLAAAVASIRPSDGPYSLRVLVEPGLRTGVIVVLLLMCVPLFAFVGQCARVGAPQRDRRLAALRMAGGTPSDVLRIVALESGLTATGGALLGALTYGILHVFIRAPEISGLSERELIPPQNNEGWALYDAGGGTVFPVDVIPHTFLIVLALALVPVAATLGSMVALRRVTFSPFGVLQTQPRRPPTIVPVVLFLVGAISLVAWDQVKR